MTKTVVGIFNDSTAAQDAFQRLRDYGFNHDEIDMSTDMSRTQQSGGLGDENRDDADFGDKVSRFFRNLFDDDNDAERYSAAAKTGTILTVYADTTDRAERAADILDEYGAINVNEHGTGSEYATGTDNRFGEERTNETSFTDQGRTNDASFGDEGRSDRSIPVIEEELQVGKRQVETGGVRVRSRIIDRPVQESLRLREEHVTLERNPVNRPATESDLGTFREGEIEVRERAEVPVVNKQARVVEEVNIRKDVQEREEVVNETVRKTDIEVDSIDDDSSTDRPSGTGKSKRNI